MLISFSNQQKKLLKLAVAVADRIPAETVEEFAWKNSWHWNLPDALLGSLVLDIREGRLGSEQKSTGFNFAYRLNLNNKPSHPKEAQGTAHTQAQSPASQSVPPQNQQNQQAGPSKKPPHVPFQQQRVFSNHHQNNSQRSQEPPKQGYLGGAKPQGAQDSQPASQQQVSAAANESTTPASEVNAPPAGPTLGPRGAPTHRAFEALASNIFKKPVGPHGAPGAGRGRGSPSLRETGHHQKNSSSGTGRSSPADQTGAGRKDAETQQASSEGQNENVETPSTAPSDSREGGSNAASKATEENQASSNEKRSQPFQQGGTRGPRDKTSNWRDRNDIEGAQQSEASGNESPGGTPGFRGRGRGRGFGGDRGGDRGAPRG